jgi:NTP pyrophosphatase (non-canonical NTP hydrolase)
VTERIRKYEQLVNSTAVYDKSQAMIYLALGLSSEAGEVAGHLKRVYRGDETISPELYEKVLKELGDVLWYVTAMSMEMGYDLTEVMDNNTRKLTKRKEENKILGRGDDR